MAEDPPHLRVLIADEDQSRVAEIANIVSGLRHSIVAQLLDGSDPGVELWVPARATVRVRVDG